MARPTLLAFAAVLAIDAAFLAASVWLVNWYYEQHLPHYDSVGSYSEMIRLMTASANSGLGVGLTLAARNALSWLQSMYAALTGPFLPAVPSSMSLLNVACLVGAQLAIFATMTRLGAARSAAFLGALLPFFPSVFSSWQGGFHDMRRDISMTLCLLACFFWSAQHVMRPTNAVGLAVGLSAGLAVWSRGNALPYVMIVLLPAVVSHLVGLVRTRPSPAAIVSLIGFPLLAFLALAVPFFMLTLDQILDKYLVGAYALGYDRVRSLLFYLSTPVTMMIDARSLVPGVALVAAAGLAPLGNARWTFDRNARTSASWLLGAGLAVCINVLAFNSLILGVSPLGGVHPYFPALVGVLGVLTAPLLLLRTRPTCPVGRVRSVVVAFGVGLTALLVVGSQLERSYAGGTGTLMGYAAGDGVVGHERVVAARVLSRKLTCYVQGKQVAFMWVGSINRASVEFYAAQIAGPRLVNYEPLASTRLQTRIDLERPALDGIPIDVQQQTIERSLEYADLIVVSEDPTQYQSNPMSQHFIYVHGRPIVERLLASADRRALFRFTFDGIPFTVLGRADQAAPDCPL